MKKLAFLCFFVFLIPALGCVGSANIEHILLTNLSELTVQADEETLGAIVFTLLEATVGAEVDTTVDEGGSGVIQYGFGYDSSVLKQTESPLPARFLASLNCDGATRLLLENAPEGSEIVEEKRGSASWCVVNIPFENLTQLVEHYRAILRPFAQHGGQNKVEAPQGPLVEVRCLEMVDGLYYQDLIIAQNAVKSADVELLDVFGIDLQWRLSMPGAVRNHSALAKQTFPLSWDLLNPPERLAVNMQPGDACPSARVKLLLEFTTTETTLATLTVPISRSADDYLQNEAVRQRLTQQGWITNIEGSSNHAPRIVALQQFEQKELALILSSIPGLGASTSDIREPLPRTISTSSAGAGSTTVPSDLSFDIDLDMRGFANTWAILMPFNRPTAFELAINSMRPVTDLDGEWHDASSPVFLWNGANEDAEQALAFTLTDGNGGNSGNGGSGENDGNSGTSLAVTGAADPEIASVAASDITESDITESDIAAGSTELAKAIALLDRGLSNAEQPEKRSVGVLGPESPSRVLATGKSKTQTVSDLIQTIPLTTSPVLEAPVLEATVSEATEDKIAAENDSPESISAKSTPSDTKLTVSDLVEVSDLIEADSPAEEAIEAVIREDAPPAPTVSAAQPEPIIRDALDSSRPVCNVVIEWLNLRPGPGLDYGEPVEALSQETELLVVGQGPYGAWIEVLVADSLARGWVSLSPEFVACQGDLTSVPEVELPSVPAATNEPIISADADVATGSADESTSAADDETSAEVSPSSDRITPEIRPLTARK